MRRDVNKLMGKQGGVLHKSIKVRTGQILQLVEDGRGSCSETADQWFEIRLDGKELGSYGNRILANVNFLLFSIGLNRRPSWEKASWVFELLSIEWVGWNRELKFFYFRHRLNDHYALFSLRYGNGDRTRWPSGRFLMVDVLFIFGILRMYKRYRHFKKYTNADDQIKHAKELDHIGVWEIKKPKWWPNKI